MSKRLTVPVAIASLLFLSGCLSDYQVRLYNFSGADIKSDQFLSENAIDDGGYALLYDRKSGDNILFPEELRIEINGQERCFELGRVNDGAYGERDETGEIIVRLKLTGDAEIYVYRVADFEFNALGSPGPQPSGYPASSSSCD